MLLKCYKKECNENGKWRVRNTDGEELIACDSHRFYAHYELQQRVLRRINREVTQKIRKRME